MMPLTLNLLPPPKKQKFSRLLTYLFIKEILEFIILTCAIIAISFLLGWLVLSETVANLAHSTNLIDREYTSHNQDIKIINKTLKDFNASAQDFAPVSPRIHELASSIPDTVRITGMQMDRAHKTFTIAGVAKTRPALIAFQEKLEHIPWLKDVSAPTSQLFVKENINFTVNASLEIPN